MPPYEMIWLDGMEGQIVLEGLAILFFIGLLSRFWKENKE